MISVATTRPLPLAFGSSVWQTTPCSVDASCVRTWSCWCGGNTSMTRSMVCAALCVCSVAKTRWPVSAAVSATEMVSRSRSSPIRMTSGSCRSTCLSAFAKLCVSLPTSRWLTSAFLCWCMNSIGSSTVTMWSARVRLTRSISAARVVDLPEPVGPVTSTRPRGSFGEPADRPRARRARASCLISVGINRKAAPIEPRCW